VPDLIHQLPEHIANQIAAGEVIQRPASAVKELLENAVDAGATEIRLIIRDGGKSLVQVSDNGNGMSEGDARLSILRHATSKIRTMEDLFLIRTMGFRGEALASIAAVSSLELRTRLPDQDLGILLVAENSKLVRSEPCACPAGTSVAMKNLFFSVPARRNFLKSDSVELRHIIEEFMRVALGFPGIFFSMENNGTQIYHFDKGNLKQRILQVLGSQYNARLVSVKESTEYLEIQGMVGKPDTARRTRGDQYFFVNNRFIRSPYLHHALISAYSGMIPPDSHPMYILYMQVDPAHIDINVHPTKQEIKFEDERLIYSFLQSAVKHALAQSSISPSLDFGLDPVIQHSAAVSQPFTDKEKEAATETSIYQEFTQKHQAHLIKPDSNLKHWKDLYEHEEKPLLAGETEAVFPSGELPGLPQLPENKEPVQIHQRYILSLISSGFILIDPQSARERILYERFTAAVNGKATPSQQSLFPLTLHFQGGDSVLLGEMMPELHMIGYQLEPFGQQDFLLRGSPADLGGANPQVILEQLLEQVRQHSATLTIDRRENILRTLARLHAAPSAGPLSVAQMQHLIDALFACETPRFTPWGNPTYLAFRLDELQKMFGR